MSSVITRQVKTLTATIGTDESTQFLCKDLPLKLDGRFVYLRKFLFRNKVTPTWAVEPGEAGMNAHIKRVRFGSGSNLRQNLSGNGLRMFERIENGSNKGSEALHPASTNARHWDRELPMGPANAAKISDYDIPVGMLQDASLDIEWNSLAGMQGTVSAAAVASALGVELVLKDELVIPPFFQRREDVVASGENLLGEALIHAVALANSTLYDAIAAGDYGSITLEAGTFNPVQGVPAEMLSTQFRSLWGVGEIGGVAGEPDAATDTQNRAVNPATATALKAQPADLQVVTAGGPRQMISKLTCHVSSGAKLSWDGTQTATGNVRLLSRSLPQSPKAVGELVQICEHVYGQKFSPESMRIPTISKAPFPASSPYARYFPYAFKKA